MKKYSRYWYLFLISLVLSILAANLYLRYYAVPQYSINSTLLIKEDNSRPNLSALNSFGDEKPGVTRNISDEIQVLRSKSLMHRVINELALFTTYQVKRDVGSRELYGTDVPVKTVISRLDSTMYGYPFRIHIKSAKQFDLSDPTGATATYAFGQPIRRPYGTFTILAMPGLYQATTLPEEMTLTFVDTRKMAEYYNRILTVLPVNKDANVLNLSFTDPIPQRGKDIMNRLLTVYNEEAREDKNRLAASTLTFIDERLKRITNALSGVEKNVEQFKRSNEVTDVNTQASSYVAQATDYNKKLAEWATQIDVLESIEEYLKASGNQYKMVPSTLGLQDQTLLSLIGKFNDLQLERERMLRTAQANNPLVHNMNEQLGDLRANILENLQNIKRGLVITSRNLKGNSGAFQERIKKVPSIERELLEINRQQATRQNLYLYLLQKREEAALALSGTTDRSKIIDPATASDSPISPNPNLMYIMATLFGLALPFTLLWANDTLNGKIQTRQDVEQLTATPILGELAHNRHESVVVTKGNTSPTAELFGLVRAHLHSATAHKAHQVVLVTSSTSGEGKTFVSVNLGASLALSGKKVIVLELDFRAPDMMRQVGLPERVGIADYLLTNDTDLSIADIITPVERVPNLFVAGAGVTSFNPVELMTSPKLAYLIDELKESFDYILIDTAPVGEVADAFSFNVFVDATIYLVRYNYTVKTQIALIDTIFRNKTLNNPLIVLNDASQLNRSAYGYSVSKKNRRKKVSGVS